jgi:hypothetical protein
MPHPFPNDEQAALAKVVMIGITGVGVLTLAIVGVCLVLLTLVAG